MKVIKLIIIIIMFVSGWTRPQCIAIQSESRIDYLTKTSSDCHGIIELDGELLNNIDEIIIDASSIGGSSQLKMLPELGKISVKADSKISPGVYELPIELLNNGSLVDRIYYSVEVLPEFEERSWDKEIIYFMLTDRFYDGDSSNNDPFNNNYVQASNQGGVYQGGDFLGIVDKLEYLDNLGITTIWISPIVLNVKHNVEENSANPEYYAYHGYWALNFEELNPHFGTLEDFHFLIDRASEYEIKIMVDVVLNHVGYGLMPEDKGEEVENFPSQEDRNRFVNMLRLEPGSDDITMSLSGLPDFITEEAEVREQIVDWQTAWLDISTTGQGNSINSFRLDTVNHLDFITLQHFKNELLEKDPKFNIIGESWGANFKNSKGFLNSGTLDSLLDFDFKDQAAQFVNGQLERVNNKLIERNKSIQSNATLGQFLSSHDEVGFLYKLNHNIGKAMVAASLQLTAKGQPVIYYGEELGQTGANNWPYYDNRYLLAWENVSDNKMLTHYKKLISFRNQFSDILARGDREYLAGSNEDKWLAITRHIDGEKVYIVFNLNEEKQVINLVVDEGEYYYDYYSMKDVKINQQHIQLTVPGINDGGTALIGKKAEGIQ